MIPWWILISLVAILVITEILFFSYFRKESYDFIEAKIMSIIFATLIVGAIFLFPAIVAFVPIVEGEAPVGIVAFIRYYGVSIPLVSFFGINYYFYKKLEGKEEWTE